MNEVAEGIAVVGEPVPDLEHDPLTVVGNEPARRVAGRPRPQDLVVVAGGGEQHPTRAQDASQRATRGGQVCVVEQVRQGVVERHRRVEAPGALDIEHAQSGHPCRDAKPARRCLPRAVLDRRRADVGRGHREAGLREADGLRPDAAGGVQHRAGGDAEVAQQAGDDARLHAIAASQSVKMRWYSGASSS
jgi:hypothetical protein